ncbi:MAG: hypothetical protein NTZ59_05400 [Bacteroidetes bacterium]|nr:hypothetical protein [Bacteroidota bacterium]
MTPKELFYVRLICGFFIIFAFIVKFSFWKNAKNNESKIKIKGFLNHIFIWYSLYDMFDSTNQEVKDFMKANNNTNKFIWISGALIVISFLFQPQV